MSGRKPRCNPEDLVGKILTKNGVSLTVLEVSGRKSEAHNQFKYICRCSCGKEVEATRDALKRKNYAYGCVPCMRRAVSQRIERNKDFDKFIKTIQNAISIVVKTRMNVGTVEVC